MSERYWEPSEPPVEALKNWASQEVQDAVEEAVGKGILYLSDGDGLLSVEFISSFYRPEGEDLYVIKLNLTDAADEWIDECDTYMPDLCPCDRRQLEQRARLFDDLAARIREKVDRILSTKGTITDPAICKDEKG
jgi:hypothetical protein